MRKRYIQILQVSLFMALGIFLVWWQLRGMSTAEWADFKHSLQNIRYGMLVPAFVLSILSHVSRAIRWKILLEPLGYHPQLKNVFASLMVGYLGNSAVPRLGEVLRCTVLARYEKLKADKLFGSIVMERAFDLICFALFILITVLIQYRHIGEYFKSNWNNLTQREGLPAWIFVLIVIAAIWLGVKVMQWLMKRYPENKLLHGIKRIAKGLAEGFTAILRLKKIRAFLFHTFVIWALYVLQVYFAFGAMDQTASLGLPAAFSVLALATVAMIATPGGIGAFPLFVMETLLLYGIAATTGKAFGWMMWGMNTGIFIIGGLAAFILLPIMNKQRHEKHSEHPQ